MSNCNKKICLIEKFSPNFHYKDPFVRASALDFNPFDISLVSISKILLCFCSLIFNTILYFGTYLKGRLTQYLGTTPSGVYAFKAKDETSKPISFKVSPREKLNQNCTTDQISSFLGSSSSSSRSYIPDTLSSRILFISEVSMEWKLSFQNSVVILGFPFCIWDKEKFMIIYVTASYSMK